MWDELNVISDISGADWMAIGYSNANCGGHEKMWGKNQTNSQVSELNECLWVKTVSASFSKFGCVVEKRIYT